MFQKIRSLFHYGLIFRALILMGGVFFATSVFAAAGTSVLTLGEIQTHVSTGISSIAAILEDVALIAGIGFIFASFFKFHQHKMNPQQIPLSQGVTLLVIGAALAVFPHLLGTVTHGIFGQSVTHVGGSAINAIIGGSSTGK